MKIERVHVVENEERNFERHSTFYQRDDDEHER